MKRQITYIGLHRDRGNWYCSVQRGYEPRLKNFWNVTIESRARLQMALEQTPGTVTPYYNGWTWNREAGDDNNVPSV